jgi:hypothetical protein
MTDILDQLFVALYIRDGALASEISAKEDL